MKLSKPKCRLLEVVVEDGGAVDLTGPEWNENLPRTAMALAVVLHNMGLGRLCTVGRTTTFSISEAGRAALDH